jgi:hypothetical protein
MTLDDLREHRRNLIRSYRRRLDEDFHGTIGPLLDELDALDRKAALLAAPEPDDKAIEAWIGRNPQKFDVWVRKQAETAPADSPKPPAAKPAARRTPTRRKGTP